MLTPDLRLIPLGPNLKYLDALLYDSEPEIKLIADMRRRAPRFDERPDETLAPPLLEFAERLSCSV